MGFLDSKIMTYDNGMQVLQMSNSVNFCVYLVNSNKVVLAKQWRACTGTENINLFGGYVDEGETYLQALAREAMEETNLSVGYNSDIHIISIYKDKKVSSGTSTERNSLYILAVNDTPEIIANMKCNDEKEGITFEFADPHEVELDGIRGTYAIDALRIMLAEGDK